MGNTIPVNEVNEYLLRIKLAVTSGNYRFVNRKKNLDSMALVGLLPKHVKECILDLTYLNYFNGPEEERDVGFAAGEYMFFGCEISGNEFFIKLKLEGGGGDETCVCISFHVAESKIFYPYR